MNRSRRTNRHGIAALLALVLACLMFFIAGGAAFAADGGADTEAVTNQGVAGGAYEVTSYDFQAVVNKDHSYDVTERITVNIPDDLQSIEFAIPSGNFRIRGLTVEDTAYTSRKASQASTVSIVDASKLTVGLHTYTIRYRILEFADRDPSKDIFYFNVLQPDWSQPISKISIQVTFPDDFPWDGLVCYAGQYGVQDQDNRIEYIADEDTHTVTISGEKIPENYGITLKAEMRPAYWEGALDGVWAVLAMMLIAGLAALILLIMWIIGGRDPRIRRTRETRPPEGISPVELGYIFNSETDISDIVRLILYFGKEGYLRISEYEPKRYRLYRLRDPEGEERLIRNAYNILFEDIYEGRALEMDQIGERLVRMEAALRDGVADGFTAKDMLPFTPLSKAFRIAGIVMVGLMLGIVNALKYSYQYISVNYAASILIGLAAMALTAVLCFMDDRKYRTSGDSSQIGELLAGIAMAGLTLSVSLSVAEQTGSYTAATLTATATAASVFLTVIMRARGKGNAALVMKFRQLRRFIYHPTPKELLENHLADSSYYYDMMLYALAFGAEESWAISFLTLEVPEPGWYTDDIEGHAFTNLRETPTTIDYARDLRSFTRTIESGYNNMTRHRRGR